MLWHTLALLSCLSCSLLYLIQNQFLFVELVQRMTKGPNSDLCCRKAGTSLLMERELKHSLDRAAGPHYKHFMRVSGTLSEMALVHSTAATQHLEGPIYGDRSPSLTVQES